MQIHPVYQIERVIEDIAEFFLALLQFLTRYLLLGDVPEAGDDTIYCGIIEKVFPNNVKRMPRPIRVPGADLVAYRGAFAINQLSKCAGGVRQIIRVDKVE